MRRNFFICGLTGWCLEILFTSIGNCRYFKKIPALFRGFIYSTGIFCFEYLSGSLLKKHHLCPWDYSNAPTNINGVIRLDYAPVWMAAGLIFEKILSK